MQLGISSLRAGDRLVLQRRANRVQVQTPNPTRSEPSARDVRDKISKCTVSKKPRAKLASPKSNKVEPTEELTELTGPGKYLFDEAVIKHIHQLAQSQRLNSRNLRTNGPSSGLG